MKIEVGKLYKTRNGNKARIYANDGHGAYSVHGAMCVSGDWLFMSWMPFGDFDDSCAHDFDLISEWTKPLDFDPSCLPAWANWIVMIEDGSWFWFQSQPDMYTEGYWVGSSINTTGYIPQQYAPKNYTGDWKDSLHKVSDL